MKIAKIFRFSGYFVDGDINQYDVEGFKGALTETILGESKDFSNDGELEENCDLALLTRHFKGFCDSAYNFDRPIPQKGEKYRHFKLGKVITVIGISRHTETEEVSVAYEYEGHIWNRPLGMFMSEVDRNKYPNSKQKYRFELIGGDDYDR